MLDDRPLGHGDLVILQVAFAILNSSNIKVDAFPIKYVTLPYVNPIMIFFKRFNSKDNKNNDITLSSALTPFYF